MDELTAKQLQILEAIREGTRLRGPTVRQIGAVVGMRSSSTVFKQLRALRRLGYLQRQPGDGDVILTQEGLDILRSDGDG